MIVVPLDVGTNTYEVSAVLTPTRQKSIAVSLVAAAGIVVVALWSLRGTRRMREANV
jgi:hypothetical protein